MNLQENIQRIKEVMNIQEQIPDSRFAPTELTPQELQDRLKTVQNLSLDDAVDVISAVIDGVPGIGNLVSAGIDVVHTLSYLIRFYYSKSDEDKIENAILALITLGGTLIPVAGNSLPIMARQGVKQVLKQTPGEILLIAKKLGLYNKTVILLGKQRWKYSLILLLGRIMGDELSEYLNVFSKRLQLIYDKLKDMKFMKNIADIVYSMILLIRELNEYVDIALAIAKTKYFI